jgi:hypothetical protein
MPYNIRYIEGGKDSHVSIPDVGCLAILVNRRHRRIIRRDVDRRLAIFVLQEGVGALLSMTLVLLASDRLCRE